jgi:adenine-specific DNA-methyltransferase
MSAGRCHFRVGDCAALPFADKVFALTFTSPPYANKLRRYRGAERLRGYANAEEWAAWMQPRLREMLRVTRGPVIVNAAGYVKAGRYHPACELLVADAYRAGIACERPVIWHKNAAPNRRDWWGNDWEFLLAFRDPDAPRVFNAEAVGRPPKYKRGGHFRQRGADGERKRGGNYPTNAIAHPRDVWRVIVGGGHMGYKPPAEAEANEAPFPEKLVEPAILALTNPGGAVLDPFSGSGTTACVAARLGRIGVGLDIRESQIRVAYQRAHLTGLDYASHLGGEWIKPGEVAA